MQKILIIISALLLGALLNGCAGYIPFSGAIYKIDVQQGNVLEQDMVNQLKPGMNKRQVAFVMGTPLLIDTFHEERWDYVYNFKQGNSAEVEKLHVALFFEKDTLVRIAGDLRPQEVDPESLVKKQQIWEVPAQPREQPSTFDRVVDTVTFGVLKDEDE